MASRCILFTLGVAVGICAGVSVAYVLQKEATKVTQELNATRSDLMKHKKMLAAFEQLTYGL